LLQHLCTLSGNFNHLAFSSKRTCEFTYVASYARLATLQLLGDAEYECRYSHSGRCNPWRMLSGALWTAVGGSAITVQLQTNVLERWNI